MLSGIGSLKMFCNWFECIQVSCSVHNVHIISVTTVAIKYVWVLMVFCLYLICFWCGYEGSRKLFFTYGKSIKNSLKIVNCEHRLYECNFRSMLYERFIYAYIYVHGHYRINAYLHISAGRRVQNLLPYDMQLEYFRLKQIFDVECSFTKTSGTEFVYIKKWQKTVKLKT